MERRPFEGNGCDLDDWFHLAVDMNQRRSGEIIVVSGGFPDCK